MSNKIPYVISEAHPDYKRPCLFERFGVVDEMMIEIFFVEKVTEFIYDRIDSDNVQSEDDITRFWENYYDEYYMDNTPWEARIFINGEWENVCPTDIQIFECLQRMIKDENDEETIEFESTIEVIDMK